MANIGIGFAVPINAVRELLPQLRTGKITRGMIGVSISGQRITGEIAETLGLTDRKGAVVQSVAENGPASQRRHQGWRRHRRVQRPAGRERSGARRTWSSRPVPARRSR